LKLRKKKISLTGVSWKLPDDFGSWRDRLTDVRCAAAYYKDKENKNGYNLIQSKIDSYLDQLREYDEKQLDIAYRGELQRAIQSFTVIHERCCEILKDFSAKL
jgi:hypothetical protein